jgi:hypothetical protein
MAVELKLGLHAIGFVRLLPNDQIQGMGSGTCLRYGKLRGILTADHVVDKWGQDDEVGLVQFPIRENQFQATRIPRKYLDEVRVGLKPYDEMGPDLAFVKLPPAQAAGSIEAASSFFDLEKQRELAFKPRPENADQFDFTAGIIAKWQGQRSVKGKMAKTVINGLLTMGDAAPIDGRDGYDRLRFTPEKDSAVPPTYGATSGGGLMRLFLEKGTKNLIELRLLGSIYYETAPKEDAVRNLICHGPRSIYERLAEKIRAKWPDEI